MRKKLLCLICLILALLCTDPALAGGRGGRRTTFDYNLFGGNWTCLATQASGRCGSATFVQYFDAACTGLVDDTAAVDAWIIYGQGQNPNQSKLYIPPGCGIYRPFSSGWLWDFDVTHNSTQNAIIWAYGARTNKCFFGGTSIVASGGAYIQTVSAGSSTVTLVTLGDHTKYTVGDWVLIAGIGLQGKPLNSTNPPNWQFFDIRLITAKNTGTGVITLSSPLDNAYKSTWPQVDSDSTGGIYGPAQVQLLAPSFNMNYQVYGLTCHLFGSEQAGLGGRNAAFYDVTFTNDNMETGSGLDAPVAIGTTINSWFFNSTLKRVELDKLMENVYWYRVNNILVQSQSPSPKNFFVDQSTIGTFFGAGYNGVVTNSLVYTMKGGTTNYGASSSITIKDSTILATTNNGVSLASSLVTYDGAGTFFRANGGTPPSGISQNTMEVLGWATPGHPYYLSYNRGQCSIGYSFTISDVRQDATNTYVDTTAWKLNGSPISTPATLPSGSCVGQPWDNLTGYSANTITQTNSGPADLTQYAAP